MSGLDKPEQINAGGTAAAAAGGLEYLDLSSLTPVGSGLVDSVQDLGDGWYRINFIDLTADANQYDDIDAEGTFLVETLGDAFDSAFGYQFTIEARNSSEVPDIWPGVCICNAARTEGLVGQLTEYATGYHSTVRGLDTNFAFGASGSGGAVDQILRLVCMHGPTSGDLVWSYQRGATAAFTDLDDGANTENETLSSGDASWGLVIGCKAADLGAGESVDVRIGKKALSWS